MVRELGDLGQLLSGQHGPHSKEIYPMGLTGKRFETYDKRI